MNTEQLTIPRMPDLWDMEGVCVSHKALSGALAHWAVFQSPYAVPENLGEAVAQFMEAWPHGDYVRLSSGELKIAVRENIGQCPLVKAWNRPKSGHGNPVFVSRYGQPKPDGDFIDLDALARNVTHELVLWAQVERAQDEQRAVTRPAEGVSESAPLN